MNQEERELKGFIHYLTHNKNLTKAQQQKRDELLARDCFRKEDFITKEITSDKTERKITFRPLSALDTAQFLSLFNNPMGLKYLTHDFDPISDGRPQSLDDLYRQAKNILEKKDYTIPSSLWAPINNYVEGKNEWRDTFGKSHHSSIVNLQWKEWSIQHKMHPINNPDFLEEIMMFRSTIRLVSPFLKEICKNAQKGLSLNVKEEKLEKADFYTNTYVLYMVIKRIFDMMNRRADKYPDVIISYKRTSDSQGRMLRQVIITQNGSYAAQPLNDSKDRLEKDSEAGDFGAIRSSLNGYCLWQVEALWDGQPYRWNILKADDMPEIEVIDENNITGFTHILTYYIL